MKTRLAFIGSKSFPSRAGVDRVVEALVRELAKEELYEIYVYGDSDKLDPASAPPGVNLIPIKPQGGKYTRALSQFWGSAWHASHFGRYDLVHLHNLEASFVLPLLRLRSPVVTTSHIVTHRRVDQWGRAARFLIRRMEWPFMFLSSVRTAVSSVDAQYYTGKYKQPVEWIPNGVDPHAEIDPSFRISALSQFGLQDQAYLLFAAGRIIPTKGCHVFFEALNLMPQKVGLPVVVVGDLSKDPDYAQQLRSMAPPTTQFIPFVENPRVVEALYSGSRLMIFPSLVEGMSMVLLEAAMARARLICSDIPENQMVLQDHTCYFRSEDAWDLAVKIQWALENLHQMDVLSNQADQWVRQRFAWPAITQQYKRCYERALGREPSLPEVPR